MVELAAPEIEAAHQGAHRAGVVLKGHEGAFHQRHLGEFPLAVGHEGDSNNRAPADLQVLGSFRIEPLGRKFQALGANDELAAPRAHDTNLLGQCAGDHRGEEPVAVGAIGQRILHGILDLFGPAGRKLDAAFRPSPTLTAVEIDQCTAQGCVGCTLLIGSDRGEDREAAAVGALLKLAVELLTNHLRQIGRVDAVVVAAPDHTQLLLHGLDELAIADHVELAHAPEDVFLPCLGPAWIDHRVEGRWRLGKAGEHGRLGDGEPLNGLSKINLGCRCKAIGPAAQKDLVDVELENLRFGELLLDLQGEQDLVNLAQEGLVGGQVKVARHLHGDGARTLGLAGRHEVGAGRPEDALDVDAAVLEEAVVLGGQDGINEGAGHLVEAHHASPFFTELPNEHTVGSHDPQWQLRAVV